MSDVPPWRCKPVCCSEEKDTGELRVFGLELFPWTSFNQADNFVDGRVGVNSGGAVSELDVALGLAEHTQFSKENGGREDASHLEERPRKLVDGSFYSGQWLGSQRHGQGRLERAGWGCYEGQFMHGKATGSGSFSKATGDIYTGQWLNDRAHGHGHYVHSDGSTYEGGWDADRKHGSGVETWSDNSRYEGTFLAGRKHGAGHYRACDESSYEGQFIDDMMEGHGYYVFADGRVYEGGWEQSRMSGHGTMTWPDGKVYVGQFQDDKKSGVGRFEWPGGCTYEGLWADGRQHGEGVYTGKRGRRFKGRWKHGKNLSLVPEVSSQPRSPYPIAEGSTSYAAMHQSRPSSTGPVYSNAPKSAQVQTDRNEYPPAFAVPSGTGKVAEKFEDSQASCIVDIDH